MTTGNTIPRWSASHVSDSKQRIRKLQVRAQIKSLDNGDLKPSPEGLSYSTVNPLIVQCLAHNKPSVEWMSEWMNECFMSPLDRHWRLGSATCLPVSGTLLYLFTHLECCSHSSPCGQIPEQTYRELTLHHLTALSLKHLSLFEFFFFNLLIF